MVVVLVCGCGLWFFCDNNTYPSPRLRLGLGLGCGNKKVLLPRKLQSPFNTLENISEWRTYLTNNQKQNNST